MPKYKLRYARVVVLETHIRARDVDAARDEAWKLEEKGELGVKNLEAKDGSWVDEIQDEETIWEIEEVFDHDVDCPEADD